MLSMLVQLENEHLPLLHEEKPTTY
jgi:hypothetical protein